MRVKRESQLSIRLTPEEYKHFLALQRASGLSQADFLMRAIDNMPVPDAETRELYREIKEELKELNENIKGIEPKA